MHESIHMYIALHTTHYSIHRQSIIKIQTSKGIFMVSEPLALTILMDSPEPLTALRMRV
jgi:hypothetical protein